MKSMPVARSPLTFRRAGLTVWLALAVGLVGTAASRAAEADSSGPVDLKPKWKVGQRIVQQITMSQDMNMTMPGMADPMKQKTTQLQEFEVTVDQERPQGGFEFGVTFRRFSMESRMGDNTMLKFDSQSDPKDDAGNPAAPVFRAISGAKLRVATRASGKVDSVQGVKELMEKASAGLPDMMKGPIQSMFTEDSIKQMGVLPQGLPDKPVKVGDEWPVNQELALGPMGTLQVNMTMTFKGWEDRGGHHCALLEHKGYLSTKPAAESTNTMFSVTSLSGDTKGRSWYSQDLGAMVESVAEQNLKMKMKTMGQEVPMQMVQFITNKVVEVGPATK